MNLALGFSLLTALQDAKQEGEYGKSGTTWEIL